MDAAPRSYADLPRDPALGVPVPFACTTDSAGHGAAGALDHRRVTQCALSRVCGVCGSGLGRPIAFLGSQDELDRLAFHFPPTHLECAEKLLADYLPVDAAVLGQTDPRQSWVLVTTAGFEYIRPDREDLDKRATFCPNSLLDTRQVG